LKQSKISIKFSELKKNSIIFPKRSSRSERKEMIIFRIMMILEIMKILKD
jgi:hypothetical protein